MKIKILEKILISNFTDLNMTKILKWLIYIFKYSTIKILFKLLEIRKCALRNIVIRHTLKL